VKYFLGCTWNDGIVLRERSRFHLSVALVLISQELELWFQDPIEQAAQVIS
jgi:hypothetical protein